MTLWSSILALARLPARAVAAVRGPSALDLPPDLSVPAVARAVSCEGRGIYGLGKGGRDPAAAAPFDAAGLLDCSGYLAWTWGESRRDSADGVDEWDGEWFWTDGLHVDATGPQRYVRRVPVAEVQPGDALVYRGHVPGQAIGHCSLVVAVQPEVRTFADVAVSHCHGPSGTGPAVTRSTGALWARKGGIAVRRIG